MLSLGFHFLSSFLNLFFIFLFFHFFHFCILFIFVFCLFLYFVYFCLFFIFVFLYHVYFCIFVLYNKPQLSFKISFFVQHNYSIILNICFSVGADL